VDTSFAVSTVSIQTKESIMTEDLPGMKGSSAVPTEPVAMNDNMKLLNALNRNWRIQDNANGVSHIKCEAGSLAMTVLYKTIKMGILHCFSPSGTILGVHCHPKEREVIIVESGHVHIMLGENKMVELQETEVIVIESGQPHSVEYVIDAWTFGILLPCSPDVPEKASENSAFVQTLMEHREISANREKSA